MSSISNGITTVMRKLTCVITVLLLTAVKAHEAKAGVIIVRDAQNIVYNCDTKTKVATIKDLYYMAKMDTVVIPHIVTYTDETTGKRDSFT